MPSVSINTTSLYHSTMYTHQLITKRCNLMVEGERLLLIFRDIVQPRRVKQFYTEHLPYIARIAVGRLP